MFRLALDGVTRVTAVAVDGRQMLPNDRVKHEDGPFQAAQSIFSTMRDWNVAPTEVDEHRLSGMVAATVREDVRDILVAQVSLGQAAPRMPRDAEL